MRYLKPEKQSIFLRASLCSACNFSCEYCAVDLGMENHTPPCLQAPLLNAKEYVRNMKMIAEHGFKCISFTGGEPLLSPQFPQILKECREIFETIEITTNGSLLPDNLDIIKEYTDVLKVSLDALDPQMSVRIAKNTAAAKTTQIIEECCQEGMKKIGINFVYMEQNKQELEKLIHFASGLKRKYGTEIYISVLDLYYSKGNRRFWEQQFVNLADFRLKLKSEGKEIKRRLRIGCDSFYYQSEGITVNMKDSISCTHRAKKCETCGEYCQEGIYSLKHSASGWISACPSNNPKLGSLLYSGMDLKEAHKAIDGYVEMINEIKRMDETGEQFFRLNHLEVLHE